MAGAATPSGHCTAVLSSSPSTADPAEVKGVIGMMTAMVEAGEVRDGGSGAAVRGDALRLPFADGVFDKVICAEVLEHLRDDSSAMAELARVLRPGGMLAISVPRFGPELVNWALSDRYHSVPGGHLRIYRRSQLLERLKDVGLEVVASITRTLFTARTGGSGASSGWRTSSVLRCAATTGSWCGTSRRTRRWHADPREDPQPFAGQEPGRLSEARRAMITPPQLAGGRLIVETIESIRAVQLQDGMIPWFAGGHADPWNHVEAAMALTVGGALHEAEHAV